MKTLDDICRYVDALPEPAKEKFLAEHGADLLALYRDEKAKKAHTSTQTQGGLHNG